METYEKAFIDSGIPELALDVTKIVHLFEKNKNINNANIDIFISNEINLSKKIFSFVYIYSMNFEAIKFFDVDDKNCNIYNIYNKNYVLKAIIDSLYGIVFNESNLVEFLVNDQPCYKIYQVLCSKVYVKNKIYIFIKILDVNGKYTNSEEMRSYLEKYYLLLRSIDNAIILVDIDQEIIIEYNQLALELLNIDRQRKEFLHYEFFDEKNKSAYLKYFNAIVNGNQLPSIDLNIRIGDHIIPVNIRVDCSYINGYKIAQVMFTDLTSKFGSEDRKKMLIEAIEQVDESVIITDSKGCIGYVNSSFEKISGYSMAEVVGKMPNILKNDDKGGFRNKILWDEISNGRVWRGNFINKTKCGETYCEDVTISPIKDNFGNIVNYVAVKRDVTQQLLLENQIKQAQKVQAIGMLAGGIAHDFNNILTSILGFAELCKIQCDSNSVIYSNVEEIIQASLRAGELVDQILKFSRNKSKEISNFSIQQILNEVIKLIRAAIRPGIKIIMEIVEDIMIKGDQTQIRQVLMNLCTNAYQSITCDEGMITVRLLQKKLEPAEAVSIGRLQPGNFACIQIKDTGNGIPQEYMQRIFDPYFSTKKLNEGAGLGLSVVHRIVNDHRGAITVESEIGFGSCFSVYLPIAGDESEEFIS